MQLDFDWRRLESLSAVALHRILKTRESVFVVEQCCAYQETDDMDLHAWHLSVSAGAELVAYARVVDPGVRYRRPSIGRVLTVAGFRRRKIGRQLMEEAIRFTGQQFPGQGIQISAQFRLRGFYESLGFRVVGASYEEDGILHVDMIRS